MHIVHIASELAPIAKVGGLADVTFGLSRETDRIGHRVEVIIPKYDVIEIQEVTNLVHTTNDFSSFFEGNLHSNSTWKGEVEGVNVTFIDSHHPWNLFNRSCIYGCQDDHSRFLYFSRAVADYLLSQKSLPDVIHLHDWQTAPIATLLKALGAKEAKTLLTVHNFDYQGRCSPDDLEKTGLKKSDYFTPAFFQDILYPEAANLLKGGIIDSSFFTTVSPTYAEEVKTPPLGEGLEPLIMKYKDKFCGILNGIDYGYWNPETDSLLPAHFSSKDPPDTLFKQKERVKKTLREWFKLKEDHRPIVGVICRLVPQKGIGLIRHALDSVVESGGQFVLLGSSPIPSIDAEFQDLKRNHEGHPHIGLALQHREVLAHLIFGGSDMLIAPSYFEPCGLTQMIALRYGTIPIVRSTGGLSDTIFDIDSGRPIEETNGFIFKEFQPAAFDHALNRAIRLWGDSPDQWSQLVRRGMEHDFSWKIPTTHYLKIYETLTAS